MHTGPQRVSGRAGFEFRRLAQGPAHPCTSAQTRPHRQEWPPRSHLTGASGQVISDVKGNCYSFLILWNFRVWFGLCWEVEKQTVDPSSECLPGKGTWQSEAGPAGDHCRPQKQSCLEVLNLLVDCSLGRTLSNPRAGRGLPGILWPNSISTCSFDRWCKELQLKTYSDRVSCSARMCFGKIYMFTFI